MEFFSIRYKKTHTIMSSSPCHPECPNHCAPSIRFCCAKSLGMTQWFGRIEGYGGVARRIIKNISFLFLLDFPQCLLKNLHADIHLAATDIERLDHTDRGWTAPKSQESVFKRAPDDTITEVFVLHGGFSFWSNINTNHQTLTAH